MLLKLRFVADSNPTLSASFLLEQALGECPALSKNPTAALPGSMTRTETRVSSGSRRQRSPECILLSVENRGLYYEGFF
jgi:hypothetical protein